MAPVHEEDDNSPNKWFILSALAWERVQGTVFINKTLSGYHWQPELPVKACWGESLRNTIPSWSWFFRCQITIQRKHIKINALKNDKLQKNALYKQRWSIQSCSGGNLQLPGCLSQYSPAVFPQWNIAHLAGSSRLLLICSGSATEAWSRLHLAIFVQSGERQIYPLTHTVTLQKAHPDAEGAHCFPKGCAGGLLNHALLSQQLQLWSPKKQINKELNDFVSEFRACDNKARKALQPGKAWGNTVVSHSVWPRQPSRNLLNQPWYCPQLKQRAAILCRAPAIPPGPNPALLTPLQSPQMAALILPWALTAPPKNPSAKGYRSKYGHTPETWTLHLRLPIYHPLYPNYLPPNLQQPSSLVLTFACADCKLQWTTDHIHDKSSRDN